MKKILSIMLTVLMCFSSMFGSVVYVAADSAATYTFSNIEAKAGDTVEVLVTYTSAQEANLTALAEITLSSADAEIVGFTYSDEVEGLINTGLSNYDPKTKSLITLFNEAMIYDGVLGTLEIKIGDEASLGDITISASSVVVNENTETEILSSVTNGTITIDDGTEPAEKAVYTIGTAEANPGQTVIVDLRYTSGGNANLSAIAEFELSNNDAEIVGFTFSDEAKAVISQLSNYDPETKSVITLFDDDARAFDGVLGTLQIRVNNDAPEGDITITATSRVQNEGVGVVESEVVDGKITVVNSVEPPMPPYFTIGDAQADAGDVVQVEVNFTSSVDVNLVALAQLNVGDKAEIIEFEFDDDFKSYINVGLSNYDAETKSVIILFKEAMEYEGIIGRFTIKVADGASGSDITVTAGSRVQNEEGEGIIDSMVYAGTITVSNPVVPEIESIVVDADAFEIADADKDNEEIIIAAAKDAIETITVKWTEGKEDTFITTDDVDFEVDTQAKTVTVSYGQFTDVIEYTVAQPIPASSLTFGDADVDAGEIAEVDVILNITENANLIGIGDISFSSQYAEIEDFVFSDEVDGLINDRLSTYDPELRSIGVLFTDLMKFNGILGTLKVKISEDAPSGDITVTARIFNVKDDEAHVVFESEIINGTISVTEIEPPPVMMHTVSFYVDNEIYDEIDVEEGTKIGDKMPADPEKEGFEFVKWDVVSGEAVTAETVVYYSFSTQAVFEAKEYTVIYYVDGVEVNKATVKYGEAIPEFDYVAPEGYEFSGWDAEVPATMPAENLDFNGTLTAKEYTVIYYVDGVEVNKATVKYGEAIPEFDYVAPEGYEFSGWDAEVPATMPAEDLDFNGTLTAKEYTVTYYVDGVEVNKATVKYGEAIPAYNYEVPEGYDFSGWDAEVPATMPAENLEFNGTLTAKEYTVTYYVDGDIYDEISVTDGEMIGDQMPEVPLKEGWLFTGWVDENGEKVTADTVVEAEMTLTATFISLDVNSDGVVDSQDSIYLLNHCVLPRLYPVDEELDLDYNGDGKVNSGDAIFHLATIALPAIYSLR